MTSFSIERYLQVQSADSPTFSAEGEDIGFLMDTTGAPQVWTVSREGGWPRQVTFLSERVSEVGWSPEGARMAFTADRGGDERQQIFLVRPDGARMRPVTDRPRAVHHLGGWSPDGRHLVFSANRERAADFSLYIHDCANGLTRTILERGGTNRFGAWSPDGDRLAVVRVRANFDHALDLVGADGEAVRSLRRAEEGEPAVYEHLHWSPDGRGLYAVTNAGCDRRRGVRIAVDTGELTEVAASSEWEIEEMVLAPAGDRLVYVVNVDGWSRMYVLQIASGRRWPVEGLPAGVYRQLDYSPARDELAFVVDGPRDNRNVWLYDVPGGGARQLTRAPRAGLTRDVLYRPETIRYPTFDGRDIPALYYRPRGAGRTVPVIIDIHGGPEGQRRPTFTPVTQYLVSRGFAVLAPNVRGSSGYGRRYLALDDGRRRMDAVRDIRWGVRWLTRDGGADPERIGVMGASYGGFMVLSCITEYPDLWAAAVDLVGIANFITFLQNTGPWRRHLREAEYGSLQEDREFLAGISPIHKADRIRTPLLVIHGKNDPRVPVSEAEQIVRRVRESGGAVQYLCFPDEGHGLVRRRNRIIAYRQVAEFFRRHLRCGRRGDDFDA